MSAKVVRIDGHVIPAPGASLSINGEEIDDTILGANWKSSFPGLLEWSMSSRAFIKGIAGYQAKVSIGAGEICAKSVELNMTAEENDVSCFTTCRTNGGFRVKNAGLRTVGLTLGQFYGGGNLAVLKARTPVTVTFEPLAGGGIQFIGTFVYMSDDFSGDVGADEEEELTFGLYVSDDSGAGCFQAIVPSAPASGDLSLSPAIAAAINSFMTGAKVEVGYFPLGGDSSEAGFIGQGFVTDLSLSASMDGPVEFNLEVAGAGAIN